MLVLIFSIIEGLSFTYFYFFRDKYTFSDVEQFTGSLEKVKYSDYRYDANLGWDPKFKTPYGERSREVDYSESLISTFGDSYTHCDQVQDNETWQTYLSRYLNKDVYNFGTWGFGTDQAYLRYKRDYQKVKTPIVTLGLVSENINRIVNVYRPFLYPKSGIYLTKPRFILNNNELSLQKNPIQKKEDIEKLADKEFIKSIKNDYWSSNSYPTLSFPYSSIFLNGNFWDEVVNGKTDDVKTRSSNLWKDGDPEIISLMYKIVDKYVEGVKNDGATPLIMFLPSEYEATNNYKGLKIISHDKIFEYCKQKGYRCFDGLEAMVSTAKSDSDVASFFNNHYSAKGNEVIAKSFYEFMKKEGLTR